MTHPNLQPYHQFRVSGVADLLGAQEPPVGPGVYHRGDSPHPR
ncbi:hypothetical protein AB0F72_17645 [Actinoplanes sp. NPDC023936]